jgi:thiol:disulfide interchange protein DsbA
LNRRQFSAGIGWSATVTALGVGGLQPARAQGAPTEGKEYRLVIPPVPVSAPTGKVDVIEFFSYACPHCNDFEPKLEGWAAQLPPEVYFHRIPVPFLFNAANFQPLYYTLETLNLVTEMQAKVFKAVHVDRNPLDTPDKILSFMTQNGVDGAKFKSVFNSFAVQSKVRQAKQSVEAYGIDGVPGLAVQGRYLTSPGQANGEAQALQVVNALVQKVRSGR